MDTGGVAQARDKVRKGILQDSSLVAREDQNDKILLGLLAGPRAGHKVPHRRLA